MIPVSGDNNGCFRILTSIHVGAFASSADHSSTRDNIPPTEHQNATDQPMAIPTMTLQTSLA